MIKIGLTGGIGSGKTTVAQMFKDKKVPVFTADIEAKKILDRPEVSSEVSRVFGIKLNSENLINKAELAKIVFNDDKALERLNSIIHPEVHKYFERWLSMQTAPYIIYEAAIIFEKNRASDFDYTILVTAPEDLRIKRVMKRDDITSADVESRVKAQWSESKKKELADFIIENINLKETQQQVSKLHEKFLSFLDK
jgi:dephospho-CoA kinase